VWWVAGGVLLFGLLVFALACLLVLNRMPKLARAAARLRGRGEQAQQLQANTARMAEQAQQLQTLAAKLAERRSQPSEPSPNGWDRTRVTQR
jgi:Tfp pilus assembly protein PilN